ncbi:unnamed protein product [Euphydryas editha]|uniref:Uncharacterized protein n=1 Tax=Euphydryas editha TaxID=104508 RepID=A0AAU9U897_EUPED|nr:unnamed protein product [Euphydryas editha]
MVNKKQRSSSDRPELAVQSILQEAIKELFGECCGVRADILRVRVERGTARALVRTRDAHERKLRASLALTPRNIRVRAEAPSLQALI